MPGGCATDERPSGKLREYSAARPDARIFFGKRFTGDCRARPESLARAPMTEFVLAEPPGTTVLLAGDAPLALDGGGSLAAFPMAFRTWGRLDEKRSNAILVTHGLSGDQVVAGTHPVTGRPGWWERLVGPGRILDTDRYFVICANVPGGCMGSVGPASIDPATGRAFGPDFPDLTIADMVRAEALLLDRLGIGRLRLVIGGSMGGMQALEWVRLMSERVAAAAVFAVGIRHTAQQIALHAIGRQAILDDPDWQGGRYHGSGRSPVRGLGVARMLAHLSYRSPGEMAARFGRALQPGLEDDVWQVESYLRHHGKRFIARFDPASYVAITRAMDRFDLAPDGDLAARFRGAESRILLAAYSSDWLYPAEQTRELADGLADAGLDVRFTLHDSLAGHDSFLLEVPSADRALQEFLDSLA